MIAGGAWFKASVGDFLDVGANAALHGLPPASVASVVDALMVSQAHAGFAPTDTQQHAWHVEVETLGRTLAAVAGRRSVSGWSILFEYSIPRRQTRPDVVLLANGMILVIEFKVGASSYLTADRLQAKDYADDLADFHEQSRGLPIVPVLVATEAADNREADIQLDTVQLCATDGLAELIVAAVDRHGTGEQIDLESWDQSRYFPTPNIIEAALAVYAGNDVRELNHAKADNLTETVDALRGLIVRARANGERLVCFVTGVPGSGKTLTGLSAIHAVAGSGPIGTYLSGNGPLVDVLQYAIAKDIADRSGMSQSDAERRSSVMIQMVHKFVAELGMSDKIPPENVIVFDEAQRSWTADQMRRKQKIADNEAGIALDVMARADDWAVIVALVGEGQEINTGEGGIDEWVSALAARPEWKAAAADPARVGLFGATKVDKLHLAVGTRSPRADDVPAWINAVLAGDAGAARSCVPSRFPIQLTRSLATMRTALRDRASVDRRVGLLASAQARRLRTFGIEMNGAFQGDINWARWFVDGPDDIRSSYPLEVAASEFKCQGLELDWTGLCWGNDFLWTGSGWTCRKMRGHRWNKDSQTEYAANRYRVLLSRARYGMVIWVPKPEAHVLLVDHAGLDATAAHLEACGAQRI